MEIRVASWAAVAALVLAACSTSSPVADNPADGGGTGDGGGQRFIADEVFARKAIAYSGYRWQQGPVTQDYPTEAQIKEDMQILVRGGWTFLRLFDCSPHADRVLKVIRDNAL